MKKQFLLVLALIISLIAHSGNAMEEGIGNNNDNNNEEHNLPYNVTTKTEKSLQKKHPIEPQKEVTGPEGKKEESDNKSMKNETIILQSSDTTNFVLDKTLWQRSATLINLLSDCGSTGNKITLNLDNEVVRAIVDLLKTLNSDKPKPRLKELLEKLEKKNPSDFANILNQCTEYLDITLDTIFNSTPGSELLDQLAVKALQKKGMPCVYEEMTNGVLHLLWISKCNKYIMHFNFFKGTINPLFTIIDLEQQKSLVQCEARNDGKIDSLNHDYQLVFDNHLDNATNIDLYFDNTIIASFNRVPNNSFSHIAYSHDQCISAHEIQRAYFIFFNMVLKNDAVIRLYDNEKTALLSTKSLSDISKNNKHYLAFVPEDKYLASICGERIRIWDLRAYSHAKVQRSKLMHLLNNALSFTQSYILDRIESAWKTNNRWRMPSSLESEYNVILSKIEKACDKETKQLVDEMLKEHMQ